MLIAQNDKYIGSGGHPMHHTLHSAAGQVDFTGRFAVGVAVMSAKMLCIQLLVFLALKAGPVSGQTSAFTAVFHPVPAALGDTMFSALAQGSNGRMYMGTCNSKGPAHLIRLDPATGHIVDLGDMQEVTGEHDPELIPQSKIHTQLVFDSRGRLWFGTHSEEIYSRKGYAQWPKGYSGGHLVRYSPGSDRFEDFGIFYPRIAKRPSDITECGLYYISMAIDPANRLLYMVTGDNVFLVVFDMKRHRVLARHPVLTSYPYPESWHRGHANPRDLEVAADGNVYLFSYEGQLLRYVRERDELERLDVWIPGSDKEQRNMPYELAIDKTGTHIYGNGALEGTLFELTVGRKPSIRDLGFAFEGFDTQRTVVHAITMGADGKVYYAGDHNVALFVYDPATGTRRCLGRVTASNIEGATMRTAWAACTAADGSLWFAGWVECPDIGGKTQRPLCFVRIRFP